jgi:hypothetical protein
MRNYLWASLVLLAAIGAPSAVADTTYTYTGNPYTSCSANYVCTGTSPFVSVTFETTLKKSQLDNLTVGTVPDGNLTDSISRFRITDGTGLIITNHDNPLTSFLFDVTTDSHGNILDWGISVIYGAAPGGFEEASTYGASLYGFEDFSSTRIVTPDGATTSAGYNQYDAGSWTRKHTKMAPEPGSLFLLGIGLLITMLAGRGSGRP